MYVGYIKFSNSRAIVTWTFDLLTFQRSSNAAIEKAIALITNMKEIVLLSANGLGIMQAWSAVEKDTNIKNKIRFNLRLS